MHVFDRDRSRLPRPVRVTLDWLLTIGAAIVFVLVFEAEVAKPYRVPSASMEGTLRCARPEPGCTARFSDRVIANRLAYRFGDPERGQIVVFDPPHAAAADGCTGGPFVKRLIGLPGDVVSEHRGVVFVNGTRLAEPYVLPRDRDTTTKTWPRVAPGHYFFMGDNRANSCDSRTWGTVPRSSLIGPALGIYWPPDRLRIF